MENFFLDMEMHKFKYALYIFYTFKNTVDPRYLDFGYLE